MNTPCITLIVSIQQRTSTLPQRPSCRVVARGSSYHIRHFHQALAEPSTFFRCTLLSAFFSQNNEIQVLDCHLLIFRRKVAMAQLNSQSAAAYKNEGRVGMLLHTLLTFFG